MRHTVQVGCQIIIVICLTLPLDGPAENSAIANIRESTDVEWLERVALGLQGEVKQDGPSPRPGELRTAAYLRLGHLGTAESLAAIDRIENAGRKAVILPQFVRLGKWPHPAWHFTPWNAEPIAQVESADGLTYALVNAGLLGNDMDIFLVSSREPHKPDKWTRPLLIPDRLYRGISEPVLTVTRRGHLRFTFTQYEPGPRNVMEGYIDPPKKAPVLGKRHWDLSVEALQRDSDGDGWTDVEERRLKLDPKKRDTDGDGIADGEDICPNYALQPRESEDEAVQILQKVVFAVYGLSGSRGLLLVMPDAKRFHVWGYGGPVLYVDSVASWRRESSEGAVFLSWRIKDRTASTATVDLIDEEGPLAGSGRTFYARRIPGQWIVTSEDPMVWISQCGSFNQTIGSRDGYLTRRSP